MKTKLTLTLKQNTIRKANDFAKSKGKSLSDIIEDYLKLLTRKENNITKKTSDTPLTDSMVGAFKQPENFDYKKELLEALEEKYIK